MFISFIKKKKVVWYEFVGGESFRLQVLTTSRIPMTFPIKFGKITLKFTWKHKRPRVVKVTLNKKEQGWRYHDFIWRQIAET